MRVAALDIGGANIKAAKNDGTLFTSSFTSAFELWRDPDNLAPILGSILRDVLGTIDRLAVTMTGELCDCFETKAEGVKRILESVRSAVREQSKPFETLVWRTDSRLVSLEDALRDPLPAAAANWLALAHLAGEYAPRGHGLLIDVGSTTTDIVPLRDGQPTPKGRTDTERLLARELVYTGVSRTPVSALVQDLPFGNERCPVSSERFATTLDAYVTLGLVPESQDTSHTADGRESTKARAQDRLARMICADPSGFTQEDALATAGCIAEAQGAKLRDALDRVVESMGERVDTAVVSGSGEFLAASLAARVASRIVSLSVELGADASDAAPAVALARIASRSRESCA